ncbi:MAG: hypothetical protein J0H01_05535 [Rhizobiales bacterium]|nr:hypothetical protein [Hyphomicrobiales bacterium]
MKLFIDNQYRTIDDRRISIAHTGHPLVMLDDSTFWSSRNGNDFHKYFDSEPGLIEFADRSWLITHATRHVAEDGTSHIFLPAIGKYLSKSPLDNAYIEVNSFDPQRLRSHSINGTTQFSTAVLEGTDLSGSRLCYTNAGSFWRQLPSGEWEPALKDAPFRHALAVKASAPGGAASILFFEIYDTPPGRRWLQLFKRSQGYVQRFDPLDVLAIKHQNVMFRYGPRGLETCVDQLNRIVSDINPIYRSALESSDNGTLRSVATETVCGSSLNQLHYEFEAFGDRYRAGEFADSIHSSRLHGLFSKLNNWIHASEAALGNAAATENDAQLLAHINFFPDIYESLNEEDYRYFTQNFKFGELYMGYHTLGKDFSAAFQNNDIECIVRREVRPQRIANTEVITYFGPTKSGVEEDFKKWWHNNNIDSHGYDINDPANAVGLLPIGRLVGYRDAPEPVIRRRLAELETIDWCILTSTRFEV